MCRIDRELPQIPEEKDRTAKYSCQPHKVRVRRRQAYKQTGGRQFTVTTRVIHKQITIITMAQTKNYHLKCQSANPLIFILSSPK